MTPRDRDYETLRAALQELRAADERSAPPFAAIRGRRTSSRSFARPLTRLAIAAALVLAAGVTVRFTRRDRLTVPNDVLALSSWRPASDALLDAPVRSLLAEAPRLGASVINVNITGELR